MIAVQVLFDKIAQFEYADEIATFFEQEGITGFRKNPLACPIANYLMANSDATDASVVPNSSFTWCDEVLSPGEKMEGLGTGNWRNSKPQEFENTPAMKSFIYNFDSGHYKNLETNNIFEREIENG